MTHTPQGSDRAGMTFMLLGMFLFTVNDALGKWLVANYAVGQLLALRSFAALAILIPILIHKRAIFGLTKMANPFLHLLRLVLVVSEVSCFYWAVRYLPLADVFMFYLAAPIFVTALSPLLLGEKVGMLRWTAVIIGFVGVILIFPPSSAAASLPAFIALAGSLSLALMMILTRKLRDVDGLQLITIQTVAVALAGSATLPFVWKTPDLMDLSLLCLLGLVATSAHFLMNHAVRIAPASVVAPFQYSSIAWAMLFGYVFWNDIPTGQSLIGITIIIGCGLFIFYREGKASSRV
ncbi:DMT family transporter [Rhodovibrionaceae bacterium A322]